MPRVGAICERRALRSIRTVDALACTLTTAVAPVGGAAAVAGGIAPLGAGVFHVASCAAGL